MHTRALGNHDQAMHFAEKTLGNFKRGMKLKMVICAVVIHRSAAILLI